MALHLLPRFRHLFLRGRNHPQLLLRHLLPLREVLRERLLAQSSQQQRQRAFRLPLLDPRLRKSQHPKLRNRLLALRIFLVLRVSLRHQVPLRHRRWSLAVLHQRLQLQAIHLLLLGDRTRIGLLKRPGTSVKSFPLWVLAAVW